MIKGAIPIFERDIIVFSRNLLAETLAVAAFPLTFFIAFGFGLYGYIADIEGVPYKIFVIPGLISMTALLSAFDDAAWSLWFHRVVQKTINEYRVNPITVYDIIVGKIFSGFALGSIKGMMVAIIFFAAAGFHMRVAHVLSYAIFIFLGSMIFSCVGTICGTLVDKPEQLGRIEAVVIIPLIFLTGLFFPLSSYPASIVPIMKLLPTTAVFDGAREALLKGNIDIYYLPMLILYSAISFALAVVIFDKKIED